MNDRITNQESTHNMYNGTVICPNHLCGKEVSDKFDHCPFCHTPLIKPKKTAEDIINEYNRKEEDLRNAVEDDLRSAIRKHYNINGEISDEQYKQLIEIYKHEVGDVSLSQEKVEKENNNHGKIIPTGGIIAIVACLITIVFFIFSTGGSSNIKAAQTIRTADQWVTYCDGEPSITRCLSVFDKIDHTTQIRIWDDLAYMVAHLLTNDEKSRIKIDSFGYLMVYMKARDDFSNSAAFFDDIKEHHFMRDDVRWASILLNDRLDELVNQYINE